MGFLQYLSENVSPGNAEPLQRTLAAVAFLYDQLLLLSEAVGTLPLDMQAQVLMYAAKSKEESTH